MAFMGILVLNVVFWIWFCVLAVGAAFLIACLIFAILYRRGKKRGNPRKWKKIVSIICGVAGGCCILPTIVIWVWGSVPEKQEITTPNGVVQVSEEVTSELTKQLQEDDLEGFQEMLEEEPALRYFTLYGYNLLGASVYYEASEIAEYLLESGADVNDSGRIYGNLRIILKDSMSAEEGVNRELLILLLEHHADVNEKEETDMPLLQYLIYDILRDQKISEEDLELLQMFLAEGADVSDTFAMNGENALEYFERKLIENEFAEEQSAEIDRMRALLTAENEGEE